ncbi:MAG: hypothetical protein N3B21_13925 [Clostridia bacterium]|nr:hypothetical protein [Clostridia bacterium]
MMQKPWFKLVIWILATSFFFMASSIIISHLSPGPTEHQSMRYMEGMMGAMHNSLMGLSMTIEEDFDLKRLIINASAITIPLICISIILGLYIRLIRGKRNAG